MASTGGFFFPLVQIHAIILGEDALSSLVFGKRSKRPIHRAGVGNP